MGCTMKRRPSLRCDAAIQIVRQLSLMYPAPARLNPGRYIRHGIFAISLHDASRTRVYRTPNYERNQSEEAAAKRDAGHNGQRDRQAPVQAIIGSEISPPVKPEVFREIGWEFVIEALCPAAEGSGNQRPKRRER